jgi:hypothetical protein
MKVRNVKILLILAITILTCSVGVISDDEIKSNLFMQRWDFDSQLRRRRTLSYDVEKYEVGYYTGTPYVLGIILSEGDNEFLFAYTGAGGVVFSVISLNSFVVDDRNEKVYA